MPNWTPSTRPCAWRSRWTDPAGALVARGFAFPRECFQVIGAGAGTVARVGDGVRNVHEALSAIAEPWQPHRLTSFNDYDVKVVKILGEFVWHTHPDTDELFMVVSGQLTIQLTDRDVVLNPGDVFVVPRGVEHCPQATDEVQAILFEPQGTINTGDAGGAMTSELRELD